jgi:cytochrome c oxidase subunit 3
MSVTTVDPHSSEVHGDHAHEHPSWLAHHFDDAEQQFDSGKLGMWLFLITEVLFFSGMFCAYALLRSQSPEVFNFASDFLNEKLGAINTGVLLFSSLTMAWGVRAAQLGQPRTLVAMLAMTLSCAAIFLGVKAVEYSHKWDLGLLPGMYYRAQLIHPEHHAVPTWLFTLCLPGILCTIGFGIWWILSVLKNDRFQREISGPLFCAALCFLGGAGLGLYLESGEGGGQAAGHAAHASEHDQGHAVDAENPAGPTAIAHPETATATLAPAPPAAVPAKIDPYDPPQAFPADVQVEKGLTEIKNPAVNQKSRAGLFFSIYYCMTGVHALHILGGMAVISWLIVKAARHEFHSKYFGPVDNVGLYWHLVDFIWIYLFPLLYLIK